MSFSSFSLFNFYQQPNTGKQPASPLQSIYDSGNGASGEVADFNWYFPRYGTNVQLTSLTPNPFPYNLFADSVSGAVQGLHRATTYSIFSGKFQANNEAVDLFYLFRGQINPQRVEFGHFYTDYSGRITGAKSDKFSELSFYSGQFSGQKSDSYLCAVAFSGKITPNNERFLLDSIFSGIINKQRNDSFDAKGQFSGGFWPVKKDNYSLAFSIEDYSVGNGLVWIPNTGIDNGTIVFSLINVDIAGTSP